MSNPTDEYTDRQAFSPGQRVELHPGCDLWMRGARFGTVHSTAGCTVVVKMDHPSVRKLQYLTAGLIRHVR